MPTIRQVVPAAIRFAVLALALVVLATARLPEPGPSASTALQRTVEVPVRRPGIPSLRLLLAGALIAGAALQLGGRRVT